MKAAIIACEMLQAELNRVISEEQIDFPLFWVQSALHNNPKLLHQHLQSLIDEHAAEFDCYLFALGQCGMATDNLRTGDYTLIIPRVDDCITLLLGSFERRIEISKESPTYFLTEKWLGTDEENLLSGYEYSLNKYGLVQSRVIYEQLLRNYRRLGLLDTGCYDLNALRSKVSDFAAIFKLNIEALPATDDYLRQLLLGPWDEKRFVITKPRETVHITLSQN